MSKTKKAKKPRTKIPGERARVVLLKGGNRTSLNVRPTSSGYQLQARRTNEGEERASGVATENFLDYETAKARLNTLAALAVKNGWEARASARQVKRAEELFQ